MITAFIIISIGFISKEKLPVSALSGYLSAPLLIVSDRYLMLMVYQNIIISLSEFSYQLKKPNVESYLLRLHLSTSFSVDQPTSFSLHARVRITWARAVTWACAVT